MSPKLLLLAMLTAGGAHAQSDPLARLSADAAAVLNLGVSPVLLLTEAEHDVIATRTIRIGEEYVAGWRLSALTASTATLTNGGQSRTVALLGRRGTGLAIAMPAGAPALSGPDLIAAQIRQGVGAASGR